MANYKNLVVGITGGIGSGKTEVCNIFKQMGALTISADLCAKQIISNDSNIRKRIRIAFGHKVFHNDGQLDRKKLAEIIFRDSKSRKTLNKIVHPQVIKYLKKEIDKFKRERNHKLLFIEAALIYEANADSLFDFVVVVDTNREIAIRRIVKRDKLKRNEALLRIRSQMSRAERLKRADIIIYNNGSYQELKSSCLFLFSFFNSICS